MHRRTLAIPLLVALSLLPSHAAHAVGPNGLLELKVSGPPVYIAAADRPDVTATSIGLGPDYNPSITPQALYQVTDILIHNAGSAPFAYAPGDFTLRNEFTGKVYAPDQSNPDIQGIALAAGVLPPGGTVEGAVSYTVGFYDDVFTVRWSHSPFIVPSS